MPIQEGAYVTGDGTTLYQVQNGRRRPITPENVGNLNITQADIQQVDPLELYRMPIDSVRQRAIGREVRRYLWSDLQAGHFMQSWVSLEGTELRVRTRTETVTLFGGYSGGVQASMIDASGFVIGDPVRYRYGVDGRAFGSGWREDEGISQVPQETADQTEYILIAHYWDPKVNIIAALVAIGRALWEIYEDWKRRRQQGENDINIGGEPY